MTDILEIILQTPSSELSEYWGKNTTEETKILDWLDLIAVHAEKIRDARHLNIKEILNKLSLK